MNGKYNGAVIGLSKCYKTLNDVKGVVCILFLVSHHAHLRKDLEVILCIPDH